MNKGQNSEDRIKSILKFFKVNEERFSTLLGIVVVFLVVGMMINYFKTANLKIWKGSLLPESETSTISLKDKTEEVLEKSDTYKVVKGDDLWHISERYYKSGYNYVDIIRENKLAKNGQIEVGQEIKIPKVEPKKITVIESASQALITDKTVVAKKEAGTIDADSYTTIKGDSLWSISIRAYGDGFKWTKIYWANRQLIGKNPNVLFTGVKLTLPKI